jgi:long-chain fatty acid transport protein
MKRTVLASALLAAFALPSVALATNGYFAHGYGMKAKGMGGASTAMTGDTFGGANNPATMVWAGDRLDIGVDLFSPRRSVSRQGSGPAGIDASVDSDSDYFLVPEFGYNRMLGWNMSAGVTVYGNGGMNTDFEGGQIPGASACAVFNPAAGPYNILCGNGRLNMDMMQLIVAPTFAYKINANHSVGVSPLLGYQRFKVDGLQAFQGISSSPGDVTNVGYDSSTGFGVRVGWYGKLSDTVSLGAAYSSKMRMSAFDKYKGLFAEQGDFDIPENYNFGIAVKATPKATVAFDIQQINYSKIRSIANGVTNSLAAPPRDPLGSANGSGFKWRDQTAFKLGLEYQYRNDLVLRTGYNYGKSPIRNESADDVTFNIIAPGVVEQHFTLGATWTLANKSELTVTYAHAFDNSVTGPSALAGTETLKMYQNSLGIAYSMKLK